MGAVPVAARPTRTSLVWIHKQRGESLHLLLLSELLEQGDQMSQSRLRTISRDAVGIPEDRVAFEQELLGWLKAIQPNETVGIDALRLRGGLVVGSKHVDADMLVVLLIV